MAECVAVAGIENGLDRPPADAPTTQPDECTQARRQLADVQHVAGRHGIEVANQGVGTVLMLCNRIEERTQLEDTAALRPRRMHRTEMHPEDPPRQAVGNDLEKRMARDARPVPRRVRHRPSAQEAERCASLRSPLCHSSGAADALDHIRSGRFLQDDEVGLGGTDDRRECLLTSLTAVANVVGEQSQDSRLLVTLAFDEGEVWLSEQITTEVNHRVP
jgi:hypothetical protein